MKLIPMLQSLAPRALLVLAAVAAFGSGAAHAAGQPIERFTLPNGARVSLAESQGIPMVDVQIDFDAGGRRDPAGQAGLASATAAMMGHGLRARDGAPALDENALSEAWSDLGASFGGSASSDRMGFGLRTLTFPDLLPRAVALAARQLGDPAFPEAVWQRERARRIASIKEANTRPGTIAAKAYTEAVYGGHPYGYDMNEATLSRISVADMAALHARALVPCRARVTVVGAVTRAQAETLVTTLLSRLPESTPERCAPLPPVGEVAALAAPVERSIPFESAQAHVYIGQPGIRRADPDYFALTVGNYILGGGGFVSRLSSEVREKRGLTYSVYSYFSPGLHAGAFTVGLQTRPDQAAQAVQVTREVLRRFIEEGPTEAELQAAKDNLIGGFALRVDSNRKLLDNLSAMAWHDLPPDYLVTWTQQVQRVSVADIKAAFARALQPGRMVTVVVGSAPQ